MAKKNNFGQGLHVLILDDDLDYQEYYEEWSLNMGFSTKAVSRLSEARDELRSQKIDVVILDLFLDQSSNSAKGLFLLKDIFEIHQKKGFGPLVIAVSAGKDNGAPTTDIQEISEYQNLGIVTKFLSKIKIDETIIQNALINATEKIKEQRVDGSNRFEKGQPLRVFLCHATEDSAIVRDLYYRLKSEDNIEPWLDKINILPGQDWNFEVSRALRASDAIVICCSGNSFKKEGYIQKEIKKALDIADEKPKGTIFIIPLKIDECELPERINHLQWVNLFDKDGYNNLLRALKHRASDLSG